MAKNSSDSKERFVPTGLELVLVWILTAESLVWLGARAHEYGLF